MNIQERYDAHRNDLDELKVEYRLAKEQGVTLQNRFVSLGEDLTTHENVRLVIQAAAQAAQMNLAQDLAGIVTTALATVFEDPYEFVVRFTPRRNTTECDLKLMKDGVEYDPLKSCGFGVADVCSIALRVAYLLLSGRRPVLVLDEVFRHLDYRSRERVVYLLRHLRDEFQIQFIIITHAPELVEAADRIFKVTKKKGNSIATRIDP